MTVFEIRNVRLDIPSEHLTRPIKEALTGGYYEKAEHRALGIHLRSNDRMVDLGAGAGYLCCVASAIIGANNVLGVEAHPDMAPVARANLRLNGHGKARVLKGAVVPDSVDDDQVAFMISQGFWASGLKNDGKSWGVREVRTPALKISDIMAGHAPTLVVMDIEGAEASFTDYKWPASVRMVILEVHPKLYSGVQLNQIFTGFFDQGFAWTGRGSQNDTVVFERIKEG